MSNRLFDQAVQLLATHERVASCAPLLLDEAAIAMSYFGVKRFRHREVVVAPGVGAADHCIFVIEGEVISEVPMPDSTEPRVAARGEPGDFMAQGFMFDMGPRLSSCIADGTTTVATLRRADFLRLGEEHPAVAFKLACKMAAHLTDYLRKTGRQHSFNTSVSRNLSEELARQVAENLKGRSPSRPSSRSPGDSTPADGSSLPASVLSVTGRDGFKPSTRS
jgi:CRP-like cAMP-binding protein